MFPISGEVAAVADRRSEVVRRLSDTRIVPVASVTRESDGAELAVVLERAGLPCIEIALRTPAALGAIRCARDAADVLVGAGTVLSTAQARAAAEAGAHFAVAPGTDEAVVRTCADLGLPFFPGAATPTEIARARGLGADVVKVFPAASLGGPAFLRAVSAVLPDVRFFPTGGIDANSAADYLVLPAVLAVAGTWLAPAALVDERRFDEVERLAREAKALAG